MPKLTTPSTGMLPMEDIETLLEYNEDYNREGFIRKTDTSNDTNKVAGVNSLEIAVAYKNSQGEIEDRGTVENSMRLNGEESTNYAKTEQFELERESRALSSSVFQEELGALRNEMYRLKGQIAKSGILNDRQEEMGFTDSFINSNIKYQKEKVSSAQRGVSSNELIVDSPEELRLGEYVGIINDENFAHHAISKIAGINGDIVILENDLSISGDTLSVYKSLGRYFRGAYYFSDIHELPLGEKISTNITDDRNSDWSQNMSNYLNSSSPGYAYSFRTNFLNEDRNTAALSNIRIKTKKIGDAPDLFCDIIRYEELDEYNKEKNGEDNNLSFVYRSKSATNVRTNLYSFDFDDIPVLYNGSEYITIFFVQDPSMLSTTSTWDFDLASGDGSNVHTYNKLYKLNENKTLFTDDIINQKDMIHIANMKIIEDTTVASYSQGLYTASFEISKEINENAVFNKGIISLRIRKEGDFKIENSMLKGAVSGGTLAAPSQISSSTNLDPSLYFVDDYYIINDEYIRKVDRSITPMIYERGWYIDPLSEAEFYRFGYTVQMLAYKKNYRGPEEFLGVIDDIKPKTMLQERSKHNEYTNIIVLETGENEAQREMLQNANKFDIQIRWQKSNIPQISENLISAIHELTISLSKEV